MKPFELNLLRPVLYYIPLSIHLIQSLVPRRVRYRALPLASATPYAFELRMTPPSNILPRASALRCAALTPQVDDFP